MFVSNCVFRGGLGAACDFGVCFDGPGYSIFWPTHSFNFAFYTNLLFLFSISGK